MRVGLQTPIETCNINGFNDIIVKIKNMNMKNINCYSVKRNES